MLNDVTTEKMQADGGRGVGVSFRGLTAGAFRPTADPVWVLLDPEGKPVEILKGDAPDEVMEEALLLAILTWLVKAENELSEQLGIEETSDA